MPTNTIPIVSPGEGIRADHINALRDGLLALQPSPGGAEDLTVTPSGVASTPRRGIGTRSDARSPIPSPLDLGPYHDTAVTTAKQGLSDKPPLQQSVEWKKFGLQIRNFDSMSGEAVVSVNIADWFEVELDKDGMPTGKLKITEGAREQLKTLELLLRVTDGSGDAECDKDIKYLKLSPSGDEEGEDDDDDGDGDDDCRDSRPADGGSDDRADADSDGSRTRPAKGGDDSEGGGNDARDRPAKGGQCY